MSAAKHARGSAVIRRDISNKARPAEFVMMDDLNAMEKAPGAQRPFGPIHFVEGHGGFWAECPKTGYGFWYPNLRAAVRAWLVDVTGYINGRWVSEVRS